MTEDEELSPKDKENIRRHHLAALALGLVCVGLGLPVWWRTTTVHRVSLPYTSIEELAHDPITYTTQLEVVWASSKGVDKSFLTDLSVLLGQQLNPNKKDVSLLKSLFAIEVREASEQELQDLGTNDAKNSAEQNAISRYSVYVGDSEDNTVLTSHNTLILKHIDQDARALAQQISSLVRTVMREGDVATSYQAAQGTKLAQPDKASVRAYRVHPGYDVTFTLMVPQPDSVTATWDIEGGVADYLKPLQQSFDGLINITVSSQVLYFIGISRKPKKGDGFFYYEEKDLPHIINPLESKLGSHASNNPGMNFIVYIPTVNRSPLYILDNNGTKVPSNAFLSPRWGGVMVYNPEDDLEGTQGKGQGDEGSDVRQVAVDMHRVMQVAVQQMGLLLNLHAQLPQGISSPSTETSAPPTWQMAAWLRIRTVENIGLSTLTLQSLARLLGQISNIVIQEDIGREVERSVECIRSSKLLLHSGRLTEAFSLSRDAVTHAEAAFFHPSLLELLYFPEDQKFAIYIPLFLPISFPILTSLLQAIKYFTKKDKQKTE